MRSALHIGSTVTVCNSVVVTGNQHVGAHFLSVQLPAGVSGEVRGDGMYNQQKIVRFTLYTKEGTEVQVNCPLMANDICVRGG